MNALYDRIVRDVNDMSRSANLDHDTGIVLISQDLWAAYVCALLDKQYEGCADGDFRRIDTVRGFGYRVLTDREWTLSLIRKATCQP